MVAQKQEPRYTVAEYFALAESNPDVKYAYIDGQVYMMSGGTMDHWLIAFNIGTALKGRLRAGTCRFYGSDVRVQISPTRYVYPDMSVTCDPVERGRLHTVKAPHVIFEVLSPSTQDVDRTQKMRYYRACPTIQEYVLIDPYRIYVEVYRRAEAFWQLTSYEAGETIVLASLALSIPIEEFYDAIELAPEEAE